MGKRYVVVGGVAGGASTAARIRRLDEGADIQIYDKGPDVSFSNCCLPNYLSGEVEKIEDLILYDPPAFRKTFNLDARVNHKVTKIMPEDHRILVENLATGECFEDRYDYLILSPGAEAIRPSSIKNVHADHVFVIKNVEDIRKLDAYMKAHSVEEVAVVGGGFIGVEAAECLKKSGKKVTLIEAMNQIMAPFDYDMVQMLHRELYINEIDLILSDSVAEVTETGLVLASGRQVKAQAVILAIGVKPEVELAREAGIEIGKTGGILVDHNCRTSKEDIYAVGDAIEVFHAITREKTRLPLAGPAQRQARNAADAIFGKNVTNKGVIGSSCIRVFGLNAASTGLNERECTRLGIEYRTALVIPNDKVGLMPGAAPLHFKLVYEYPSGKLLGCQAIGKGAVVQRVNVIAAMITMHGSLEDLKDLELCYAPAFATAKDVVHYAALTGLNQLNGVYRQVPVTAVRGLVEEGAYILDVRGAGAYAQSHIKGAVNIPLDEIRDRYEEIPRDRAVYVHCRTSWNSYYALCALKGYGFDNVVNIQGSFLALSYYEYFNDMTTERQPIVTGYNFN